MLDTSRPEAQVMLLKDNQIIGERHWENTRALGRQLLAQIDSLLREHQLVLSDLQRIAVVRGPGHYSAVRVGVVTATMLAYAQGVPLLALTSQDQTLLLQQVVTAEPVDHVQPVYKPYRS